MERARTSSQHIWPGIEIHFEIVFTGMQCCIKDYLLTGELNSVFEGAFCVPSLDLSSLPLAWRSVPCEGARALRHTSWTRAPPRAPSVERKRQRTNNRYSEKEAFITVNQTLTLTQPAAHRRLCSPLDYPDTAGNEIIYRLYISLYANMFVYIWICLCYYTKYLPSVALLS